MIVWEYQKNKKNFEKGYKPNWSKEVFIKKDENTLRCTYVIWNLNGEEVVGALYERVAKDKSNRS